MSLNADIYCVRFSCEALCVDNDGWQKLSLFAFTTSSAWLALQSERRLKSSDESFLVCSVTMADYNSQISGIWDVHQFKFDMWHIYGNLKWYTGKFKSKTVLKMLLYVLWLAIDRVSINQKFRTSEMGNNLLLNFSSLVLKALNIVSHRMLR